jgi:hypothetical protein
MDAKECFFSHTIMYLAYCFNYCFGISYASPKSIDTKECSTYMCGGEDRQPDTMRISSMAKYHVIHSITEPTDQASEAPSQRQFNG